MVPTIGMKQHSLFSMQESFDEYCEIIAREEPEAWDSRIAGLMEVMGNSRGRRRTAWEEDLREAWSSEDFPLILGDVIDRSILARYRALGDGLRVIFRQSTSRVFNVDSKRNYLTGLRARHHRVSKGGEYIQDEMGEGEYSFTINKYGKAFSIYWEDMLDDVRGIFAEIPTGLAQGARYTEDWFITNMLFTTTGPRTTYFEGDGGQSSVSSAPLTVNNLKNAYHEFITRTGRDDAELIQIEPVYLWHSKHLTLDVQQILGAQLMITGQDQTIPNTNPVSRLNLQPLVLNWLDQIVTTDTISETAWGLFASDATIPVGEFAFLAGHEGPQVFIEESTARRISGSGSTGPEGTFHNERFNYKCRSVFGGTTFDSRAGWASKGQ